MEIGCKIIFHPLVLFGVFCNTGIQSMRGTCTSNWTHVLLQVLCLKHKPEISLATFILVQWCWCKYITDRGSMESYLQLYIMILLYYSPVQGQLLEKEGIDPVCVYLRQEVSVVLTYCVWCRPLCRLNEFCHIVLWEEIFTGNNFEISRFMWRTSCSQVT